MKHLCIVLLAGLALSACGGSTAEPQNTQDTVKKAAAGDKAAMHDLENQVREKLKSDKAAQAKSAKSSDARAAFQKAQLLGAKSDAALQELAQAGNAHAQVYLAHIGGAMSSTTDADKAKYRDWLENAAQNATGEMHQTLSGLTYPLSSEAAFVIAEDYLASGKLYDLDEKNALSWLIKAADLGQPEAMYKLAIRNQYGLGMDEDKAAAKSWMQKSANAGWRDAVQGLKGLE